MHVALNLSTHSVFPVGCRAVLNDSYRTQLCLLHAPYVMAIACMHVASVLLGRSIQNWLETLTCDLDEVRRYFEHIPQIFFYMGRKTCPNVLWSCEGTSCGTA